MVDPKSSQPDELILVAPLGFNFTPWLSNKFIRVMSRHCELQLTRQELPCNESDTQNAFVPSFIASILRKRGSFNRVTSCQLCEAQAFSVACAPMQPQWVHYQGTATLLDELPLGSLLRVGGSVTLAMPLCSLYSFVSSGCWLEDSGLTSVLEQVVES